MTRQFVYADGFVEGEIGEQADYLLGWKLFRGILIYTGKFHGQNVQRNIDGTVSARPGLKKVAVTGLPTGAVLGYGTTQFPGRTGWVVVGNTLYGFDNDNGGAVFTYGTFAQTPTVPVVGLQSGPTFLYLTSQGDGTYVADINAKTLTRMVNAPGGRVISLYNSRLVVANLGGTLTNRVTFSEPFAPGGTPQFAWLGGTTTIAPGSNGATLPQTTINVVDATQLTTPNSTTPVVTCRIVTSAGPQTVTYTGITGNQLTGCLGGTGTMSTGGIVDEQNLTYFDCGDAWDVTFMTVQRTHLLIGKQTGWWVYQGEPGLNAVLRQALATTGPFSPLHGTSTQAGLAWYLPLFTDAPTEFNGSAVGQLRYLRFANRASVTQELPPVFGAQALDQLGDVMFVSGAGNTGGTNLAAEFHNGAWAYHAFGVNVSGFIALGGQGLYLCDAGGVGVTANFYIYDVELDRPVKSSDTFANFGDNSTTANPTFIEIPEWESRDGSEVVVRSVLVGFKKWNTGSAQTNHIDCTVTALRQFRKAGDVHGGQSAAVRSWDETPSTTTMDGQYQEYNFDVGDQITGNGLRVRFDNLRGVAIQKIQVIIDIEPTRV